MMLGVQNYSIMIDRLSTAYPIVLSPNDNPVYHMFMYNLCIHNDARYDWVTDSHAALLF
jgi:hypothetical protein